MPGWIVDLVMVILILGMTYALMSEGLWGAALMFFNVLFAGLIAFNFYEWLAEMVAGFGSWATGYADTFCLLVTFLVVLILLRLVTESIAPAMVRFPTPVYHIGRVFFGFATACLTIGFLMLTFHTSPVHKKMFGVVDYKYGPPFGQALDMKWLSFFQYTSGQVFALREEGNDDPFGEYGDARVFDPRGRWLIDHQNARPYGTETVPESEGSSGGGDAGAAQESAGGAGGAAPAAGPKM
jgi:hypothetical protein